MKVLETLRRDSKHTGLQFASMRSNRSKFLKMTSGRRTPALTYILWSPSWRLNWNPSRSNTLMRSSQ